MQVRCTPQHARRLAGRGGAGDDDGLFRQLEEEMAAVAEAAQAAPEAAGKEEGEQQPPRTVPRRHERRPVSSFDSVVIWGWIVRRLPLPSVCGGPCTPHSMSASRPSKGVSIARRSHH